MMTATKLPALLRGCIEWRDNRPWVDNDALMSVADWCEANGKTDEAVSIRRGMAWDETNANLDPTAYPDKHICPPGAEYDNCALVGTVEVDTHHGRILAYGFYGRHTDAEDAPTVYASRCFADGWQDDEAESAAFREEEDRVCDLARWDVICTMLGYPPLRLIGEE